jgi:uncharacterized membrane protein
VSLNEVLDLVFRWAHLIAGIMWIGNSMLFNWLDRNLITSDDMPRLSQGKIYMVHSGAFYEVEKKLLAPGELPRELHWFKWQNGITWLTGISLLVIVYFMNHAAFLMRSPTDDPNLLIGVSLGSLVVGWALYDTLWRFFANMPGFATFISLGMLVGAVWGYSEVFSGRGAFIMTGVLMGTLMTGNVWLRILPSQRSLIAATKKGEEQDPVLSQRAKQRSIHNNYLTFPLLFIMISNHFPATTGHHLRWVLLLVILVGGAGVRHFMNAHYDKPRRSTAAWLVPAFTMGALTIVGLVAITQSKPTSIEITEPVSFARAQEIVVLRCASCHSAKPTDSMFPVAPNNVVFDTAEHIVAMKARIKERAVDQRTMPFLNRTDMTDRERAELGKWIADGAKLK